MASCISVLVLTGILICAQVILEVQGFTRTMQIEVKAGRNMVQVKVNHGLAYEVDNNAKDSRGLHVIVLNQATGSIMAQEIYDMYGDDGAAEEFTTFLKMVSPGRILIFATLDESSFKFTKEARDYVERYGSKDVGKLGWRWSWAMVCFNQVDSMLNETYSENSLLSTWGKDINITADVELKSAAEISCNWPQNDDAGRHRKHFCDRFEGYGSVCDCASPAPIAFYHDPLPNRNLEEVPVAIVAGNRPYYLFRTLQTMMQVKGSDPRKTVVFVDGFHTMPVEVAKLFGVKSVQHAPIGVGVGRISEHYKYSLKEIFSLYPRAQFAIVLEDDLEVSPDFFSFFSQTLPILEKDPTVYCVSAWNDQGYDHTCSDSSLLYRVETMPGLGWLLKRSIFKEELEPKWPAPEQNFHWDMWMRLPENRKERECIIPDISRTYHFGIKGLNMDKAFHDQYFANHTLNMIPDVKLRDIEKMTKPMYEVLIMDLVTKATPLDHSKNPCDESFFPNTMNKVYVMFIEMTDQDDFTVFKEIAKCMNIWDLDMRGFHKSLWRMFHNSNQLLIVGTPASPYAKFMPQSIKPITFKIQRDEL